MAFSRWFFRVVAAPVVIFASSLQAQQYTFTNFDAPTGSNTAAYGINGSGQITGYYYDGGWHGFLRSSGGSTFTSFDAPGGYGSTFANGINDSGQIVGSYPYGTAGSGFLRSSDGSTFTNINDPSAFGSSNGGGFGTVAHGINKAGQIVGFYYTGNTVHGFLWKSDGTFTSFDDPSAIQTIAKGINSSGQITGSYSDSSGKYHGFLRSSDGSTFTNFDHPSAGPSGTLGWGINDSGQIVGFYFDGSGIPRGFLRKSDGTFTNLDDPSATRGTEPIGINNSGQVVGLYVDAGGTHGFVTSLPPADVALFKGAAGRVKSGQNLTYGIGVVNFGPASASGVVVTDILPDGTTFVSAGWATASCISSGGGVTCTPPPPTQLTPCAFSSGTVSCSTGQLAPFTFANPTGAGIQVVVRVTAPTGSVIRNTATVAASNPDPNETNNVSSVSTTVTGSR